MPVRTRVLDPSQVDTITAARAELAANISATYRCSLNSPPLPEVEWLRACVLEVPPRYEVIYGVDGNQCIGIVVWSVLANEVKWLVVNANYAVGLTAAVDALLGACVDRYGSCTGTITNDAFRTLLLTNPRFVNDHDKHLIWRR